MKSYLLPLVCASFICGIAVGKISFSKTITETKEIQVSAFPEGINLGELCEGYYGSYANELKEKAEAEILRYKKQSQSNISNYEEGIKEGMKKSIYW